MRMLAEKTEKLERKQYLVSPSQIAKVQALAKDKGASEAEIVRMAIEAYDPEHNAELDHQDLMELVSQRLKEAITSTKHASRVARKTLRDLDQRGA